MIGQSLLKDGALVKLTIDQRGLPFSLSMFVIWKDTPDTRLAVTRSAYRNTPVDLVIGLNFGGKITFKIGIDNRLIVRKPKQEEVVMFFKLIKANGYRYVSKKNVVYKIATKNERKNIIDY